MVHLNKMIEIASHSCFITAVCRSEEWQFDPIKLKQALTQFLKKVLKKAQKRVAQFLLSYLFYCISFLCATLSQTLLLFCLSSQFYCILPCILLSQFTRDLPEANINIWRSSTFSSAAKTAMLSVYKAYNLLGIIINSAPSRPYERVYPFLHQAGHGGQLERLHCQTFNHV